MAVTRESIKLVSGQWTSIYQESGIPVGTKIAVQNIGSSDIRLSVALFQPEIDSDSWQKIQPNDIPMTNDLDDPGAWAFSPNQGAKINVWVVA
ncbi:MAG: hypothetical protein KUG81_10340 [Gammaproteobacteria bacterium]|nr:hypothetical protein [Gammaproteobacteria bacterium]